jgi:hypothetical protein
MLNLERADLSTLPTNRRRRMKTVLLAVLIAFSATASAQSYYNNDYVRSMSSDEYQVYDRTQRQIQQSQMQRMHDEEMQQRERMHRSMESNLQDMEFDRMQERARYR